MMNADAETELSDAEVHCGPQLSLVCMNEWLHKEEGP
jgi:hypothetical protein